MGKVQGNEISLKDLIRQGVDLINYFKKKWIFIVCFTLSFIVFGVFFSVFTKPYYIATLTFALEDKSSSGSSGLSSIASNFGLNIGAGDGGAFAGDNIIELIKSRLLIEKTLLTKVKINDKRELIINRYIDFHGLRNKWKNTKTLSNLSYDSIARESFSREQDSVLGIIQNQIVQNSLLVFKVDKKLSIISVKVKSKDEVFSKVFCENLVKNVTDFYIETKVGKSRNNVFLLQTRVDSVKRALDQAMYGRASFVDQNLGLIRQSAAVPKLKQEMQIQMLGAMYSELVKNLELNKLSLMREEPLIQIIDSPRFPIERQAYNPIYSAVIGGIFGLFFSMILLTIYQYLKSFN